MGNETANKKLVKKLDLGACGADVNVPEAILPEAYWVHVGTTTLLSRDSLAVLSEGPVPLVVDFLDLPWEDFQEALGASPDFQDMILTLLNRADLVSATARYRDYLLGALASFGRINSANYDADSSLANLLETENGARALEEFVSAPRRAADAKTEKQVQRDAVIGQICDDKTVLRQILVITGEPLAKKLAGPAIRAREIALRLSVEHDVKLLSTVGLEEGYTLPGVDTCYARYEELHPHVNWAQIIIFQGYLLENIPWLAKTDKFIVADVYDPMHLEQLEQAKELGATKREETIQWVTTVLNRQIRRADLLLCASNRQQEFWEAHALVQGRVRPGAGTYREQLDELIKIVPFGIEDQPIKPSGHGIKGTVKGISPTDKVIIWGGGVYNWFDPLTLIKAVAQLAKRHNDVRLYFMGMKHPNPDVPDMKVAWEAKKLSDSLGLTDRFVFFNTDWVPYDQRANYLADADLGASTHFQHVETYLSFRTRILDYLWAGLPIVATTGDSFGDDLDRAGIGIGVYPKDVTGLEEALEELLYNPQRAAQTRENVRVYAEQFHWKTVLEPLVEYCRDPHHQVGRYDSVYDQVRGETDAQAAAKRVLGRKHYLKATIKGILRRDLQGALTSAKWFLKAGK